MATFFCFCVTTVMPTEWRDGEDRGTVTAQLTSQLLPTVNVIDIEVYTDFPRPMEQDLKKSLTAIGQAITSLAHHTEKLGANHEDGGKFEGRIGILEERSNWHQKVGWSGIGQREQWHWV
jgi:hypothetical protein